MTHYGFVGSKELMSERVSEVGYEVMMGDISVANAEYNRQIDALLGGVVERTTVPQKRIYLPGDETLQPLDDWGNPLPVQPSGYYDIGLPIQGAGIAWGDNRISRELMTMGDADRFAAMVFQADTDWLRRHVLAAWLTNTTWTYADDLHGNITVQPLANGDSVTYVRRGGASATDNHFLGQANAIDDSNNPFPTIYGELNEHPSNSGPYVAYVATNLVNSIEGLTNLIEADDPTLIIGADTTRLRIQVNPDVSANEGGPVGFGERYIGRVDGVHVVEWASLPSNYLVAHATGAGPFLGMREYPAAALQGLFPEMHSPDGNLMLHRFLRYAGFGATNRVAALAMEIEDASYDIPTGFTAPLKV